MRKLALHASALSDDEYALYTTSLKDIALGDEDQKPGVAEDDAYYQDMVISGREARAWLRGRYSHLPTATVDSIIKLILPSLGPSDTMSGTEFFAALRLVVHADNGKPVDRALAFVQANPKPPQQPTLIDAKSPRPPSPLKRSVDPQPLRRQEPLSSPTSHNPFTLSQQQPHDPHPQPPLHPSHRSESSKSFSSLSQPTSYNPFVNRAPRSEDGSSKPPLPPRKPPVLVPPPRHASSTVRDSRSKSPTKVANPAPAIPPKPSQHVTSNLIKQSLQASKVAQSMKKAEEQLEKERIMQVLKSSSVVSGTNIHNQHQYPPPKLTYSSSASSGSEERAPPLPRRRQRAPSPPTSVGSLDQVALAAHPTSTHRGEVTSPFRSLPPPSPYMTASPDHSPIRPSADLPTGPPPTHPDRRPHAQRIESADPFDAIYGPTSTTTAPSSPTLPASPTTTRVFRSKSLHQPVSPVLPPLPPPIRRKRPESVQVLSSGEVLFGSLTKHHHQEPATSVSSSSTPPSGLSRHASTSLRSTPPLGHRRSSLSVSSAHSSAQGASAAHDSSPFSMTHVQRTIATLQPRLDALQQLQPRFDKARYKAEAGLSKRGFMRDGHRRSGEEGEEEEGLMSESSNGRGRVTRARVGAGWNGRTRSRGMGEGGDDEDERWDSSKGMDEAGSRGRSPSPVDDVSVEPDRGPQDNLKWPVGEGWKPL